jgi:hypothetical protein
MQFWALLGPARVRISTPVDLRVAYARLVAGGAAPVFELTDQPAPATCRLVHHDTPGAPRVELDATRRTLTVSSRAQLLGDGKPIIYLAGLLLERQLQLRGWVSLVAACVRLPTGAALLVGGEGAGKTSTALTLCLEWDGRLVGNDLCVVGARDREVFVAAGTKSFCLRYTATQRNAPRLIDLFPTSRGDGWSEKLPVAPDAIGLQTAEGRVRVAGLYLVHIDDRSPLHIAHASGARIRYLLYENATRIVRASAAPFLIESDQGFAAYVPSLDSVACHRRRVAVVKALMGLGPISVIGPVDQAARWIADDLARRDIAP